MLPVSAFDPKPITLTGDRVRLEPLHDGHARDLLAVGSDPDIFKYLPRPALRALEDARAWIAEAGTERNDGRQIPFAIVELAGGRAVGSTRYLDLRPHDRALEIGWTWLGKAYQRTGINRECKLLLLRHAFEDLGAIRVQLKTDGRNVQSQTAIERIGGVREGVLRDSMIMWDGHLRDSVYYSILAREWPQVKEKLEAGLVARGA